MIQKRGHSVPRDATGSLAAKGSHPEIGSTCSRVRQSCEQTTTHARHKFRLEQINTTKESKHVVPTTATTTRPPSFGTTIHYITQVKTLCLPPVFMLVHTYKSTNEQNF